MSDRIAEQRPLWSLPQILTCLVYLLIIKVIVGVVDNYRDYLPPNFESEFLQGREPYFFSSYRRAFSVHIFSGPVSLILGMLLINERFRLWSPRRHRIPGRLQTFNVLLFVVPSGLWMAFWSDGGLAGITGFSALAIATGICCVEGWRMAVRRRFAAHRRWMWRCSLLLCSAVTLRIIGGIVEISGLDPAWTYPTAAWISWLLPLGVFEMSERRTRSVRKAERPHGPADHNVQRTESDLCSCRRDNLEPLTKPPWPRCFESGRDARKSDEATHVVEER